MSEILMFNGALNHEAFWGIQWWMILAFVLVCAGVIIWYLWKGYFERLQPVDGIYYSQATRHMSGNPALLLSKNNYLELATERGAKMIDPHETYLEASTYEREWKRTTYTSCGGIDCDIVIDLADWCRHHVVVDDFLSKVYPDEPKYVPVKFFQGLLRWGYNSILCPVFYWPKAVGTDIKITTSPTHEAIAKCVEIWNQNEVNAAKEKNPDAMVGRDEIHSYLKFRDHLLSGKITCPELHDDEIWVTITWQRILTAFKKYNLTDSGGWEMQRAQEFRAADQGRQMFDKVILYVIVGFIIIWIMIGITKMMAAGGH